MTSRNTWWPLMGISGGCFFDRYYVIFIVGQVEFKLICSVIVLKIVQ